MSRRSKQPQPDHKSGGYLSYCEVNGDGCVFVQPIVASIKHKVQVPGRYHSLLTSDAQQLYILPHCNSVAIPRSQKRRVHRRDKHTCFDCSRDLSKYPAALDVHHIILRKDGGPNEDWNLVTLCKTCHIVLHQKMLKGTKRRKKKRRRKPKRRPSPA